MTAKERLDMLYKKAQQEELESLKLEHQKLDDALNAAAGTINFYGTEKNKQSKSKNQSKKDKDKKNAKKGVEVILDHKYDKLMSYGDDQAPKYY